MSLHKTTTMNGNDASPFFDASQGNSPDVASLHTPSHSVVESESTPIGQRVLFPASATQENNGDDDDDDDDDNNNNNDDDDDNGEELQSRLYNQMQDLDLGLVELEFKDPGTGGSTCSAEELEDLTEKATSERLQVLSADDTDDIVDDHEGNCVLMVKELGEEVSVAKRPSDWVPKAVKTAEGKPEFVDVDNPGGWDDYTFRAKFTTKSTKTVKRGQYTHHALPTGARPVPPDADGNRQVEGWDFHYDKWSNENPTKFRSGGNRQIPFPNSRKGCLDYALLKKMGLTKTRLVKKDAFFFWQLLFPICDPLRSDIPDDPRLPFYSKVETWSNGYAASSLGLFGSYGHEFKPIMSTELLHFDMIVVRDGVLGGMDGAIYRRQLCVRPRDSCHNDAHQVATNQKGLQVV